MEGILLFSIGIASFILGLMLLTKKIFVRLYPKIEIGILYLLYIIYVFTPIVGIWLEEGIHLWHILLILLSGLFVIAINKCTGDIDVYNVTRYTLVEAITESLQKNGMEYKKIDSQIILTQFEGVSIKIEHSKDYAKIFLRKFSRSPISKKSIKRDIKEHLKNKDFREFPVSAITYIVIGIIIILIYFKLS